MAAVDTAVKLEALRARLAALAPGLIAVSGGLDSRLLAHLAWYWGLGFQPLHFAGPHLAPADSRRALRWIRAQGRAPFVVAVDPLEHPAVRGNTAERCYHCKLHMFQAGRQATVCTGLSTIIDGTQADDLQGHRPGLKALEELGVASPLAHVGLTKAELRAIARDQGLDDADQPARPCLLTRLEYGMAAEPMVLGRVAVAEEALEALGLRDFRLRLHADGRAVLQAAAAEAHGLDRAAALAVLARCGFSGATVLATQGVSGYFDRQEEG